MTTKQRRAIRRVICLARAVARTVTPREPGEPREAARQVAYELAPLDGETRELCLAVLASLAARNEYALPRVGDVQDQLSRFPRIGAQRVQRRVHGEVHRDRVRLPLEAARAVPIVHVIERHGVALRRCGRDLHGHCPLHDRTRRPNLRVNPRKGLWHCFTCDAGGDGIAFVMQVRGIDFATAVKALAA